MEHSLKCNVLKCRQEITDRALVTTCSHIFCIDCAGRSGLAGQSERRSSCPACNSNLGNPDDAVIAILSPSDEYKTSVLSGLSPNIIMECAGRALSFWAYQTTQEIVYQKYLEKTLTDKYKALDMHLDKTVNEANAEIESIQGQLRDLALQNDSMRRNNLYKLVKHSTSGRVDLVNKRLVSLATQVQDCLGLPMFKGPDVRSSDWSQALNMQQITYSAGDAYAGLQLYHVLDEQRMALTPRPPLPYHVEYNLPIRLAPGVTIPSPEELAELATPVQATATASGSMTPAASTMTAAAPAAAAVGGGGVTRQPAAIDTSQQATTQSTSASASAPPLSRSPWGTSDPTRNMDARVLAAESRVATYRASKTSMRTTPTSLRSYYLWHDNEGVGPEEVASILRVPPLQTNTVVGYVLEAIKLENLPFDKKRLRNEVLHLLPRDVMERRYPAIFKAAHQVDVAAGKSESDYAAAKSGWPL
ncbi:E3 ubiquitin-protein ligase CCNB1IP1 like [Verticillium longisporum]|nr:E3 ubiquitin-protein ligase CCNB1IP1 like [Verticillium longisporum]